MRYLATLIASFILITPFTAFAQTVQEQHDALILQLITLLTQEVQLLEAQLNAQATGSEPSTFSTTVTPILQHLTMPQDQSEIIVHDDSDFYQAKDGNHVYSIFVKNKDGEFDPATVATITKDGQTQDLPLRGRALFDTSTAMINPHQEWGTLYHSSTPFTISAEGIDKEVTQ